MCYIILLKQKQKKNKKIAPLPHMQPLIVMPPATIAKIWQSQ